MTACALCVQEVDKEEMAKKRSFRLAQLARQPLHARIAARMARLDQARAELGEAADSGDAAPAPMGVPAAAVPLVVYVPGKDAHISAAAVSGYTVLGAVRCTRLPHEQALGCLYLNFAPYHKPKHIPAALVGGYAVLGAVSAAQGYCLSKRALCPAERA